MELKYYLVATIFCFRLLLDTNAIHFKSRANFEQIAPCSMTGGNIFARNRIWERPCKTRRQIVYHDLSEFASRERGPKHTVHYDPTYGYEPYWEYGDWVFDKVKTYVSETQMCGAKCPMVYMYYGKICAADKNLRYETFPTYCAMRDVDCDEDKGFKVVYRGKCFEELITYPTNSSKVVGRVDEIINDYYARSPITTVNLENWGKFKHGGKG